MTKPYTRAWNRCDVCGKFIALADFGNGAARQLVTPDSHRSREAYETLCRGHAGQATRAWTRGQCAFVFLAGVMAIWAVVLL